MDGLRDLARGRALVITGDKIIGGRPMTDERKPISAYIRTNLTRYRSAAYARTLRATIVYKRARARLRFSRSRSRSRVVIAIYYGDTYSVACVNNNRAHSSVSRVVSQYSQRPSVPSILRK